jgi:hypothetical protein
VSSSAPERPQTAGKPWLSALVVFGLACLVFAGSSSVIRIPPAWATFEFCQYAEIGRNLAVERRFDTRLIEPMALAYVDAHGGATRTGAPGRWPVIDRFPLPAMVVASLMTVFGPTDLAAAWANGLALALLAALLHVVVWRRLGRGWAWVASLLFVLNPAVFGYFALLGTPDPLFALLFVLVLLAWQGLVGREARPQVRDAIGFGLLAGFSYLARFNAVLFLVPMLAMVAAYRRWRMLAVSGGTALLVISPLLAYNLAHFGRPTVGIYSAWNLLDRIGIYRVEPWLYYQLPDAVAALFDHPEGLARKWAHNLFVVIPSRLWTLWELLLLWPFILVAAVASLRRQRRAAEPWLAWAVGLFGLQLVVFSALRLEFEPRVSPHHGRYFFWFAPVAIVLAVEALAWVARLGRAARVAAVLIVLAQVGLFAPTWWAWILDNQRPYNLGRDPVRQAVTKVVGPSGIVASNQPQMLAWNCGLRSMSLPADLDELERLSQNSSTPPDYLFIDLNFNAIELDHRWSDLVRVPPGSTTVWEKELLHNYTYILPPLRTRPLMFVFLRRKDVPAGPLEREYAEPSS